MKNNKMMRVLGNLDLLAACCMTVILIILTFINVFMRYILRTPITWNEEVQMLLFLWIVFLGGSAAFRSGSHIAIEILVDALPKKIGAFIENFDILMQLLILGYVFYQEVIYYLQLASTDKVTNLLRIPYTIAYLVVPVGGGLMIISMLFHAYQTFIAKKKEVDA